MPDSYYSGFDLARRDADGVEIPLGAETVNIAEFEGGGFAPASSDDYGHLSGASLSTDVGTQVEFSVDGYPNTLILTTYATAAEAERETKVVRFLVEDLYETHTEAVQADVYVQDLSSDDSKPRYAGAAEPGATLAVPFTSPTEKDVRVFLLSRDEKGRYSDKDFQFAEQTDFTIPSVTGLPFDLDSPTDGQMLVIRDGAIINVDETFLLLKTQFGAPGDGVASDSPALQAALNHIKTNQGGSGTIVFPRLTLWSGAGASINFDTKQGNIKFLGNDSTVLCHGLTEYGVNISNTNGVSVEGFTLIGSDDNTYDAVYGLLRFSYVEKAVVQTCDFAGIAINAALGVSSVGVICGYAANLHLKDSFLGGCVSLNGGLVEMKESQSLIAENTFFRDYLFVKGVSYAKSSHLAFSKHHILIDPPLNWNSANVLPDVRLKACQFDEHHHVSVKINGTARQNITADGCTWNSGIPLGGGAFGKALAIDTARKVNWRHSWVGFDGNVTDYEAASFEDVDLVETDSVYFDHGAKYLSLLGNTKKLVKKYSDFQGNGTYPNGINNAAGAEIEIIT